MKLQKTLLSWGGIGYFPWAPGTMGSLATLPLLYLFSSIDLLYVYSFSFTLLVLSVFITHHIQKKMNLFDPSWIVVDEVLGMITAWLFFPIWNWPYIISLFILFRFFDIIKIWPANWVDHKLKNGAGTIFDDIISGLYVGGIFFLLRIFFPSLAKSLQIL